MFARSLAAGGMLLALVLVVSGGTCKPEAGGGSYQVAGESRLVIGDGGPGYHARGLGGGGQIHALAIHPTQRDAMLIGTDNAGAFRSDDGGRSWIRANAGMADEGYDQFSAYGDDAIGIDHPEFSGFFLATFAGIWSLPLGESTWTNMTPMTGIYWALNTRYPVWDKALSFSSLDWDGDGLVVAGAGRVRIGREESDRYESAHYPEAPTRFGPSGKYSVWRYIFDDSQGAAWRPWTEIGDVGAVRDVSVAVVGGDTLVAVASRRGVYVWNGDSLVDFTGQSFHRSGSRVGGIKVDLSKKHLPWNIHLTDRGTAYLALDLRDVREDVHSGIWKFHDVTDTTTYDWEWVGDGGKETSFDNDDMWDNAAGDGDSGTRWTFLEVLDGTGAAPDTLFATGAFTCGHPTRPGLARCYSPYSGVEFQREDWAGLSFYDSRSTTGIQLSGGTPAGGYGWLTKNNNLNWGMEASCEPAAASGGMLLYQPNGRLFVSSDYGSTWRNSYCQEHPVEAEYWLTKGYVQSGTAYDGMAVWPEDGTLLVSQIDHGMSRSLTSDWQWLKKINPPVEYIDKHDEGRVWSTGSGSIATTGNWQNTGRPACVVAWGNYVSKAKPARLMVYWDSDGDGSEEWKELSKDLRKPRQWMWLGVEVVADRVYASYVLYDGTIGHGGAADSLGVIEFEWSGTAWGWNEYGHGLPNEETAYAHFLQHANGYLWLGMDGAASAATGGVWRCDPTVDPPGNWSRETGFGTAAGATSARDVLGMHARGDTVVVGSSGAAGNSDGSFWICTDSDAAVLSWSRLFNTSSADLLGGLSANAVYRRRGWTTDITVNERMTNARLAYIAADGNLWFGLTAHQRAWGENGGLWFFDGTHPAVNEFSGLNFDWADPNAAVEFGDKMAIGMSNFGGLVIRVDDGD